MTLTLWKEKRIFRNLAFKWYTYSRDKKDTDPYNISPIEMRSLWMEIKYIESNARLLDGNWVNKGGLDLSKEVLWVSVDQRAADLRAVKVEGWSYCPGIKPGPHSCGSRWAAGQDFFRSPTLTACSFAALWPTETHSTSFERSKPRLLTQSLSKRLEAF